MNYEDARTRESQAKETPLDAYLMCLGILRHNDQLERGIEPVDSQGNPLYVEHRDPDTVVIEAYGSSPEILRAIQAAQDKFNEDNKELING